jgi:Tol biopolymer transport system component
MGGQALWMFRVKREGEPAMRCAIRPILVLVSALLLIAASLAAQKTDSAQALLRAAMDTAVVDGDLNAAIKQYQAIVARFKTDRAVVATALVHMAECYQKLGDAEARRIYERVVREFADQREAAAEARARLTALGGANSGARTIGAARRVWAGPDVDFMGKVSPDGRFVSMVDWETGDLALRDLRTGEKRRMTTNGSWAQSAGLAQFSAISPDGSRVAYAWRETNSNNEDLRVVGLNGGQPHVIYRNEDVVEIGPLDWSPNGKQLVAVFTRQDRTNQIAIVSVADGSVRVVKSFDWRSLAVIFSPDGRYIAYNFAPTQDAADDVFLIATDGSREVPIVTHPAHDFAMGWSPDGSRLLFVSDRTGTNGVWTIRVSGGRPRGEPELLMPDIGRGGGWGGITRTGDFFYGINLGVQDVYTATMDPATGLILEGPTPLKGGFHRGKFAAAWSSDGKQLAYISQSPHQGSAAGGMLSIQTLKTGQVRDIPLQLMLQYANNPTWLPDDRAVLVWGPDLRGRRGFYRVDLSTGTMERTTPGVGRDTPEPGRFGAISPDGKKLFYWVGVGQRIRQTIRMQDLETGEDREVYPNPAATFALSPDGGSLAVVSAIGPASRRSLGVHVVPVSGGEPRVITAQDDPAYGLGPVAWSQDGKHVLFVRHPPLQGLVPGSAANELWRVPVGGGAPQKLAITLPAISRVSVNPDGRRLAISAGSAEFEVWLIENLLPRVGTGG